MSTTLHIDFRDGTGALLLVDANTLPYSDGEEVTVVWPDDIERTGTVRYLGAGIAGSGGEQREHAVYDATQDRIRVVNRRG